MGQLQGLGISVFRKMFTRKTVEDPKFYGPNYFKTESFPV